MKKINKKIYPHTHKVTKIMGLYGLQDGQWPMKMLSKILTIADGILSNTGQHVAWDETKQSVHITP